MHILIIPSEEFIPSYNPLAGIFQYHQAMVLQEKGHHVGVFSLSFPHSYYSLLKRLLGLKVRKSVSMSRKDAFYYMVRHSTAPNQYSLHEENKNGIRVLRAEVFWKFYNSASVQHRHLLWQRYARYMLNYYIEKYGRPDIIHAHNMIYGGMAAIEIAAIYSIPYLITEHSSQYAMGAMQEDLYQLAGQYYRKATNLTAVSPALAAQLRRFFPDSGLIKCLPNVLEPSFEQVPLSSNSERETIVRFLHVANFIPLKGQEDLLRAFALAFSDTSDVQLVMAGGGPLQKHLETCVTQLGISHKVILMPWLNRNELLAWMDKSHVFVLPSHYETFGVVLIEALSRGLPLIATRCGGPECIVNSHNGLLVDPHDVEAMAMALKKMYNDYGKYDREQLRKDCVERFGMEAFYRRVMELYQEAMSG